MDYKKVRGHLRQAESELLSLIDPAKKIKDYDEMQECLNWAREISVILKKIPSDDETTASVEPARTENKETKKLETPYEPKREDRQSTTIAPPKVGSDELPCYFAYQGKMFKVGQSRGDNGELYKKSMPLEDVLTVSSVVESLLNSQSSLSVTDVMQMLNNELPVYKVNLTLGVLTQMGVLMAQGRGRYAYAENSVGTAGRWMDVIQDYPQKLYLLDEIALQRKG